MTTGVEQKLVLYNRMCVAIRECAEVDEARGIKDEATRLEAYARIRDNVEAERQFAEIRLRASIRIGELSRELEKAQPNKGHGVAIDGQTKAEQLEAAGIPVRTAHRYEALTGGREKQAQTVASEAAEVYFATQLEKQEVPTMNGLKSAIESALIETLGEPPKRTKKEKKEVDRFIRFIGPIRDFQRKREEYDPIFFAQEEMEFIARRDIDGCEDFIQFVRTFVKETKKRFGYVIGA